MKFKKGDIIANIQDNEYRQVVVLLGEPRRSSVYSHWVAKVCHLEGEFTGNECMEYNLSGCYLIKGDVIKPRNVINKLNFV